MPTKRLRIFAGPNGSGKSTIFREVDKRYGCPCFVNADEIHKKLSTTGRLSFDKYTILVGKEHLCKSFRESAFIADFLRLNMLNIVPEFSMETVMSDARKIDYIDLAKRFGYRIYLYFVSTKDVKINVKRVASRVEQGGHNVPEGKIRDRYKKSLDNVFEALKLCDRAYFFDNSDDNDNDDNTSWKLLAEYNAGILELSPGIEKVPNWLFVSVIEKMSPLDD